MMFILTNIWTLYKPRAALSESLQQPQCRRGPSIIQYKNLASDRRSIFPIRHPPHARPQTQKNTIRNQILIFLEFLTLENIFSFRQIDEVTRLMDSAEMEFSQI